MDQSAASDGDNEPAPVQPVQPRRILRAKPVLARSTNRNASGLAGQLVPGHQKPPSSSIFQSSPPITRHTRLEAAMIVAKTHSPLLSLQALVPTSSPLHQQAAHQEQQQRWNESITGPQYHHRE